MKHSKTATVLNAKSRFNGKASAIVPRSATHLSTSVWFRRSSWSSLVIARFMSDRRNSRISNLVFNPKAYSAASVNSLCYEIA
jgi:hypothetical protein